MTSIFPEQSEQRSLEQIQEHYELEKQLADRLRNSTKQERQFLYTDLYDQLYRQIPHHPQLSCKALTQQEVERKMRLVRRYLKSDSIFLEIGAGDCQFSIATASLVQKVYAVDVSTEVVKQLSTPSNFELIISDGCNIPVEPGSIEVAYSNQLMEHLHPDDALEQLKNLYAALNPGGIYICITPNQLAGPHDVSQHFDTTATGFHLKEYTYFELVQIFKTVGFSKLEAYAGGKGIYLKFPLVLIKGVELLVQRIPSKYRRKFANLLPVRALLGINLVAYK